jgi:hypothetical protein
MESTNASTIERGLLWMVSGLSGADLENACIAQLHVDLAQVKAVIDQARKQLTLAAEYTRCFSGNRGGNDISKNTFGRSCKTG